MAKFDLISLIPQKVPLFINERYYSLFESLIKDIFFAVSQPAHANDDAKKKKFPFFTQANSYKQQISLWNEVKKSINNISAHPSNCPEIVYKDLFLRHKKFRRFLERRGRGQLRRLDENEFVIGRN